MDTATAKRTRIPRATCVKVTMFGKFLLNKCYGNGTGILEAGVKQTPIQPMARQVGAIFVLA